MTGRGWLTVYSSLLAAFALGACDGWPGVVMKSADAESAARLTGGDPQIGKQIIAQVGCGHCHTIEGVRGARGLVGPPLNGIARRVYIAGVLPNTPDNMVRWIYDPPAVDSLTAMPKVGVTAHQARHIAAYLYTLR